MMRNKIYNHFKSIFTVKRDLKDEFEKLGPWFTKFIINEKEYGGKFNSSKEECLNWFFQYFPNPQTILELGSLEGGHTFSLAKNPNVKHILAIEGRQANIDRARFIQKLFEANNVEFIKANLENIDLTDFGHFDVVFCVGLLYHLPKPWDLIEQITKVSDNLFLRTHYADSTKADITLNEYNGMYYEEHGLSDPLGGLSEKSFWPTLDSLNDMLRKYDFKTIRFIDFEKDHPNGLRLTAAASK